MTHHDHLPDQPFTSVLKLDQAIQALVGIIEGISIDKQISETEVSYLQSWVNNYQVSKDRYPLNEIIPIIENALKDGVISKEEKQEILCLAKKRSQDSLFFNQATSEIRILQGILTGILADREINKAELQELSKWLSAHESLKTFFPYDEIKTMVTAAMADKARIQERHEFLVAFFRECSEPGDSKFMGNADSTHERKIIGVCATSPTIKFERYTFCFSDEFSPKTKSDLEAMVKERRGIIAASVSATVNYLIVGAGSDPVWPYACSGREVEKAVALRKKGNSILLIHENDFLKAAATAPHK